MSQGTASLTGLILNSNPVEMTLYLEWVEEEQRLMVTRFNGQPSQQWFYLPALFSGKSNVGYLKNVQYRVFIGIDVETGAVICEPKSGNDLKDNQLLWRIKRNQVYSMAQRPETEHPEAMSSEIVKDTVSSCYKYYALATVVGVSPTQSKDDVTSLTPSASNSDDSHSLEERERRRIEKLSLPRLVLANPLSETRHNIKWECFDVSDDTVKQVKMELIVRQFDDEDSIDVTLLVKYLSSASEPGLFEFLMNKLYAVENLHRVEFYLPQLLNIFMTVKDQENGTLLEIYLLDCCVRSIHFALRLAWLMEGEMNQRNIRPNTKKKYSNLKLVIEYVVVNGKLPIRLSELDEETKPKTETETEAEEPSTLDIARVSTMPLRLKYFDNQMQFFDSLIKLSTMLKSVPVGHTRKRRCKQELETINKTLKTGVYVPYCSSDDRQMQIVRICVNETIVITTRERVPLMLFFEIVEHDWTCGDPDFSSMTKVDNAQPRSKRTMSLTEIDTSVTKATSPILSHSNDITSQSVPVPSNMNLALSSPHRTINIPFEEVQDVDAGVVTDSVNADDDDFVLVEAGPTEMEQEAERQALLYAVFGESWEEKKQRLSKTSPYGHLPNWNLCSFIAKSNDDIRQEHLCMQLIECFRDIWIVEDKLPIYLRPYQVFVTHGDGGLIETVPDTVSLDGLKKKFPGYTTLLGYFLKVYGDRFRKAQQNFVESMAGYSVICYLLQIKDRHNGNILLDRNGFVTHIDFGFFLNNSPGRMNFETAPFKLTTEMLELMQYSPDVVDPDSPQQHPMLDHFRMIVFLSLKSAAKHKERIINLIEMMLPGNNMPCFIYDGRTTIKMLRERFHDDLSDFDFAKWSKSIIEESINNYRTVTYDRYQYLTNGILS